MTDQLFCAYDMLHFTFSQTQPANPLHNLSVCIGGFAEAVGVIALTASLAAIMSTADSLIIAISQLVAVEVIWPWRPHATQNQMAWAGRFTSLVSVIMGLIIGILWKGGVSALTGA